MSAVIQLFPNSIQTTSPRREARVADCEEGYTRIANDLLDAILSADLTQVQFKVVMAIIRKTYGFNKKVDRISDSQISDATGIHRTHICNARNDLLERKVLIREQMKIGLNKVVSDWKSAVCGNRYSVAKSATKTVAKSATPVVADPVHTKDNINTKDNIRDLPPISPQPKIPVAQPEVKPAKPERNKNKPAINYQACAELYNQTLGDKLPHCLAINDKRRKGLDKIFGLLLEPTLECFAAYLQSFVKQAGRFYFGDNDSGWKADFDYLLRETVFTKTREGSLMRANRQGKSISPVQAAQQAAAKWTHVDYDDGKPL
jgi:phage replication O-like protein O